MHSHCITLYTQSNSNGRLYSKRFKKFLYYFFFSKIIKVLLNMLLRIRPTFKSLIVYLLLLFSIFFSNCKVVFNYTSELNFAICSLSNYMLEMRLLTNTDDYYTLYVFLLHVIQSLSIIHLRLFLVV